MPQIKLSEESITSLTPPTIQHDVIYWDTDTPGFGVRVHKTGNKSYVVRWLDITGKTIQRSLGPVENNTLTSALAKAKYRKTRVVPVKKRPIMRFQCGYTAEGVHHFTKIMYLHQPTPKYCSQEHFHLANGRSYPISGRLKLRTDNTPDQDIALLQHQLDDIQIKLDKLEKINEQRVRQIIEETLETKIRQMFGEIGFRLFFKS